MGAPSLAVPLLDKRFFLTDFDDDRRLMQVDPALVWYQVKQRRSSLSNGGRSLLSQLPFQLSA